MLSIGKLPHDLLSRLLNSLRLDDPSVIVGPAVGEDATVLDVGTEYLIAKTDPITFATDAIGWYVVCVNSNDIATMGALPRWLLTTILLPDDSAPELVERIFEQLQRACDRFDIVLCGGHTEITHGIGRPIVVGAMLGTVARDALITSDGAQVGDDLLLTKSMAIEATAIIAREKSRELADRYDTDWVEQARNFLYEPGISVLEDARIACKVGGVHAMHDPTEGGVATAVHELARRSEVGALLWEDALPLLPETQALCSDYALNPLGAISSGALLIAADAARTDAIVDALAERGIPCARIGKVVTVNEGVRLQRRDVTEELPLFVSDEIARLF